MQLIPIISFSGSENQTQAYSGSQESQGSGFSNLFAQELSSAGGSDSSSGQGIDYTSMTTAVSGQNILAAQSQVSTLGSVKGLRKAMQNQGKARQVRVFKPSNSVSGVKLTQEDLSSIKNGLKKGGFSDDEINDIYQQMVGAQGLNWNQLAQIVRQKYNSETQKSMSTQDKTSLQGLFGKLGFSQSESDSLISDFERGKGASQISTLLGKLDSLAKDSGVTVSSSELAALGRGLKLSSDTVDKLAAAFSGQDGTELRPGMFKKILGQMRGLAEEEQLSKNDGMAELNDSLEEAMAKAEARQGVSAQNSNSSSSTSKANASESMQTAMNNKILAMSDHAADKPRDAAIEAKEAALKHKSGETGHDQAALNGDQAHEAAKSGSKAGGHEGKEQLGQRESEARLREELSAKLKHEQNGQAKNQTSESPDALAAGVNQTLKSTPLETARQSGESASAPRVAQQIESGILSNLSDGTKQLTLQLSPDELGRVDVTLQVKNKEVYAVIKTETNEAGKAVSEQLNLIKESLEQQGFKVSKLDVQTGLSQNESQFASSWQGHENHNQARQRQESLNLVRRSSLLGGVSDLGSAGAGLNLEANYQSSGSRQGLDIIT